MIYRQIDIGIDRYRLDIEIYIDLDVDEDMDMEIDIDINIHALLYIHKTYVHTHIVQPFLFFSIIY